jgi:sigma-B regulation protein RsbU (phosphoserine phosphatase)
LEQYSLVEKLSLQAGSFQEGFETLTKSTSFEELLKNFRHLLRGYFIITDIHLFHKTTDRTKWKSILSEDNSKNVDFTLFEMDDQTPVKFFTDKEFNAAIVLALQDSSFLGILIGKKLDNSDFNDFDKITLQILLQVFSSAYRIFINQKTEKQLIFELNEKILQLNNLIDTGIELSRYDNQNLLFEIALGRIATLTNAASAVAIITKSGTDEVENQITFPKGISFDEIFSNPYRIESSFEFNGKTYRFVLSEKETRKGTTSFNELDELLLNAISRQVNASIENRFLYVQSLEKEKIEKELDLAASIQQKIIPKELPKIEGYQLAGINIPSRWVGGDYYDCIDMGDDKFAFIMADVAGKGVSAALLVNTLNAALYSYLAFNLLLPELADKLNKLIFKSSPPDKYITFLIAVLNSKTGELEVVNAGHNPALVLRNDGKLEQIEAGGTGLGMFDFGIPYTGHNITIEPGDKLFLYTDGIPEAMNLNEELYSDEKMIEFFKKHSDRSPKEFITLIVEDVKKHVSGAEQSDDITSLILKRI